ncbi:hypothetical protein VM102_005509 [Escherichia coli]|nr:hypothetical protein [Escherichia coli]
MNTSLRIRVPEFSLTVPAFEFQITMVVKAVNHLRRWFFGTASADHQHCR